MAACLKASVANCLKPTICLRILRRAASKEPTDYSNFPKAYVEREKDMIEYKNPKGPQYLPKVIKKSRYNYTMHRPWEMEAKEANEGFDEAPEAWVEPLKDWSFYRGDRVEILVGEDKGKQGVINFIVRERNWVTVEGLNCEYVIQGKTADFPGLMVKRELPLLVNREIRLIDPSDNSPTDVEWRYTEQGEHVRVSVRTGRIIPIPVLDEETYDYKRKDMYLEQPKDTTSKDLAEITFNPQLKTFEMEIAELTGIKEHRIPTKLYWY